jgi:DNA-binding NarL/FixJ family response regulator
MVTGTELINPVEREIFARRDLIDRLRESIDVIAQQPAPPAEPAGAIDWVSGAAEIRGLLKLAMDACRLGVLVLCSDAATETELIEFLDGYTIARYDVEVRVLCPHRRRADFADRARTVRMIHRGAEVRTVSRLPQTTIIFDRALAVLLGTGEPELPTAQRVRDRTVAHCLAGLFDQLWDNGIPVTTEEPGYQPVVDEVQQAIARLMAQGFTDEVVARKLGMSVRTCRRHIAALLRNLNSVSRFQAGVHAAGRLGRARAAGRPTSSAA